MSTATVSEFKSGGRTLRRKQRRTQNRTQRRTRQPKQKGPP